MLHVGPLKRRSATLDLTHLRFPWEQHVQWSLNLHWSSYFAEAKTFTLILSTSVTMRSHKLIKHSGVSTLPHDIGVQPKSVGGRLHVCRLKLRSLFDSSLCLRFLVHFYVNHLKWPPGEKINRCLDCWLPLFFKLHTFIEVLPQRTYRSSFLAPKLDRELLPIFGLANIL